MMNEKAILYCRAAHDESITLEAQKHLIQNYAHRAGYSIVGVEMDAGSGMMLDRPALQRIIQCACAGEFDVVVVKSLDRIVRNPASLFNLIGLLTQHHVALVSTFEGQDFIELYPSLWEMGLKK